MTRTFRAGIALLGVCFALQAKGDPALSQPLPEKIERLRCGTPFLLPEAAKRPRATLSPRAEGAPLQLRDAFGEFSNVILSERFAFKWGDQATLDIPPLAEQLLEALEISLEHEVDVMGHIAPLGSDAFFINVYLGGSGGAAPPSFDFAAAYVNLDEDGIPYIVVHPNTLAAYGSPSQDEHPDPTLAHELYHAIQFSTGNYALGTRGYWYWEATAEWISTQVFPESINGDAFVPPYLMYPHLSLEYVDYPDTGTLIELHHYGAQLFPQFLSQEIADPSLIKDSWMQGTPTGDPLEVLDQLLAERGFSLAEAFGVFSAHNALLDYERRENYQLWLDAYLQSFPGEDFRFAAEVESVGTDGLQEVPAALLPERFGYNVIRLKTPPPGDLTIHFSQNAFGTKGSPARFHVTLVREREDGGIAYETIPTPESETPGQTVLVEYTAKNVGTERALYLVVAAQPDFTQEGEVFPYRFQVTPIDPLATDTGPLEFVGGGCAVTPGQRLPAGSTLLLALAGLVVVLRRRSR